MRENTKEVLILIANQVSKIKLSNTNYINENIIQSIKGVFKMEFNITNTTAQYF